MIKSTADSYNPTDFSTSLQLLQTGGFVKIAGGDTIIVACDGTDNNAVDQLVELSRVLKVCDKLILVDNTSRIQTYTDQLPDIAWDLIEMSEKPLFLVFDSIKNVASNLIYPNNDIAFGIANDVFLKNLSVRFRKPLFCVYAYKTKVENKLLPENTHTVLLKNLNFLASKIKLGKGNQIEILRK